MTRLLSSSSDSMEEELETSVLNSSRRASTASDLGQGGAGDEGEDHIRVICRCVIGAGVIGAVGLCGAGDACAGSRTRGTGCRSSDQLID